MPLLQWFCDLWRMVTTDDDKERWRRGRDSNPRYGYPYAAFRVRCIQPLCHLSRPWAVRRPSAPSVARCQEPGGLASDRFDAGRRRAVASLAPEAASRQREPARPALRRPGPAAASPGRASPPPRGSATISSTAIAILIVRAHPGRTTEAVHAGQRRIGDGVRNSPDQPRRGNAVDLDIKTSRPCGNADQDAGGRVLGKIAGVDCIDRRYLIDRRAVDIAFQDVVQGRPCCFQAEPHLLQDKLGLALERSVGDLSGV